jgi:hypothetical protein
MKIRPPVAGRTTATLVEYRYSPTHKRTMPVRLGSFNIKCDPEAVMQNVKMQAGVELDFATLAAIREYLMANRPSKFSAELVAQCRAELMAEFRSEVLAEVEIAAKLAAKPTVSQAGADLEDSPHDRLRSALRAVNQGTLDAQAAYKLLPRRIVPSVELLIEYQQSWFATSTIYDMMKQRSGFNRPTTYVPLRGQILDQRQAWHDGDAVPERPKAEKSVAEIGQERGAQ